MSVHDDTPGTPAPPACPARALIVDDEPLLRAHLAHHLATLWPDLQIAGEARNGREAVDLYHELQPDVVFLDVHMPGMNGVEAARMMGPDAHLVFVTAYEQYAVQAFDQGAIDYVVKPFERERLAESVARVRRGLAAERAQAAARGGPSGGAFGGTLAGTPTGPGPGASVAAGLAAGTGGGEGVDDVLAALAAELRRRVPASSRLQWIRASVGQMIKLIPVDEVLYFRSDEKYTLVAWVGGEALIRKSIRELLDGLDPDTFIQVHRSTIVNLRFVSQVVKGPNETAEVHLKGRDETLAVSRNHVHWFRQY